ncbi:MAG: T9SS type A sorting domain-containing protein [Saprospiraceae bacterium]|nr:T9SS type A sorting domain-containing protein [Candidatus Vicinibacter affinis]
MHSKFTIFLCILLCYTSNYSQYGNIYLSLNTTDYGYGQGDGPYNSIKTIAAASDGKIIIGGDFTKYNHTKINIIARLNSNGSLDTTFKSNLTFSGEVHKIIIQPDGKILVAGSYGYNSGILRRGIARLNSNGSIDTTFNPGTGVDNRIMTLVLQGDGKIILGGKFGFYNGYQINSIARIHPNGSLDSSFNPGSGTDEVLALAIQNDGNILVGGDFDFYNGIPRNNILRIQNNGLIDNSFGIGKGFIDDVNSIIIQPDGQILVGGYFAFYNDSTRLGIARLNTNGTLDSSFNPSWSSFTGRAMALQKDGRILTGGSLIFDSKGNLSTGLARLNPDGSKDLTFVPMITKYNTFLLGISSILIQIDGKILLGGTDRLFFGTEIKDLIRINQYGTMDQFFNTNTGSNGWVNSTSIQSDGKIIASGWFTEFNGISNNFITRLLINGTVDPTFNTGSGFDYFVNSTLIQPDGKIIVVGFFNEFNKVKRRYVARLNMNGTLDNSFVPGFYADDVIKAVALQSDGKILLAGGFDEKIVRLYSDGTFDNTFEAGFRATGGDINSIAIQSDGKIIVGGSFNRYGGITRAGIARLHIDGTLDLSFDPKLNRVIAINSIAIQTDNKILIGGSFGVLNSRNTNLTRLNMDGSIDASFNTSKEGPTGEINRIAIQKDNKIIVAGGFSSFNSVSRIRIAKLHENGSLDQTFDPGIGADGDIQSVSLQGDGKIIIGGEFTSYNGIGKNRITRLHNSNTTAVENLDIFSQIKIYSSPMSNELIINYDNDEVNSVRILSIDGRIFSEHEHIQQPINKINLNMPSGIYILEIKKDDKIQCYKFIH